MTGGWGVFKRGHFNCEYEASKRRISETMSVLTCWGMAGRKGGAIRLYISIPSLFCGHVHPVTFCVALLLQVLQHRRWFSGEVEETRGGACGVIVSTNKFPRSARVIPFLQQVAECI